MEWMVPESPTPGARHNQTTVGGIVTLCPREPASEGQVPAERSAHG